MSDHVIGIVAKLTSKEAGKNNNLVYNICIEEEGRDDEWYGHGFDEPNFQEGDEIEFDIQWNGDYPNIDVDTVNVLQEGEPKSNGRSSRGNSRSSGRSGSSSRSSGSSRSGSSSRGSSRSSSKPSSRSTSRSSGGNKAKGKGADTTMSKDEWKAKDNMIRRQACMNTAINLAKLLFEVGAVKLPTKKADQFDAVVALCDEEAERLYDQYEEQVNGGGTQKRGGSREKANRYEDDIPE